jgi:hypothetical protein
MEGLNNDIIYKLELQTHCTSGLHILLIQLILADDFQWNSFCSIDSKMSANSERANKSRLFRMNWTLLLADNKFFL